jgi:hypothetical protein
MPPLGYIEPKDRTQEQADAHAKALASMPKFAIAAPAPAGPVKVVLTDFWKQPSVVQDVGFEFNGFHQLTGSCFPAGTPVRMWDGSEKPIESVEVGNVVVTHRGRAMPVTQVMRRPYTGKILTFNVSGFPFPLTATADHQVAVAPKWMGGEIEWKRADEIEVGDRMIVGMDRGRLAIEDVDLAKMIGERAVILDELMKDGAYTKGQEPDVPVSNVTMARHVIKRSGIDWKGRIKVVRSRPENAIFRHVPICPSLGRLIGIYLAEGGCHEGRVVFTLHAEETALAAEIQALIRGLFGVEGELVIQPSRPTVLKVRFDNLALAEAFKAIVPGNVYSKRVPGFFFRVDESTRIALLLGWMAGDGYVGITKKGNVRITGVTVCADLARDMTTLALSCGLRATCLRRKARKQSRTSYSVDFAGKKAVALFPSVAHRADGPRYTDADPRQTPYGYAREVKLIDVREVTDLPVFDFEVASDHSFIANGLVVHNCVGASAGNAVATLAAIQRCLSQGATKAMVPWWPYNYGRTRYEEGDRGQGEGAVDSVMGKVLAKGVFEITQPGLPKFSTDDGLYLTSKLEMQWSDGAKINPQWAGIAAQFPVGTVAPVESAEEVKQAIINGYPILYGCSMFVGHGGVKGSGTDAYVRGKYDGRGGHSTCFLGYWDHPNDGPIYLYSNQWPTSTYPKDPAGGGRCTVWIPESEVNNVFSRYGGRNGEAMALSHLNFFPAQPEVINWSDI